MNSQSDYRYYNQNDYYYQYRPLETNVQNNNYSLTQNNNNCGVVNFTKYNSVQNKFAEHTSRQFYSPQNSNHLPAQPNSTYYNNSASLSQHAVQSQANYHGYQQNDSMQNHYHYGQSVQTVYAKSNNSTTVHWQNLQTFKRSEPKQSWYQICENAADFPPSNQFTAYPQSQQLTTTANLANMLVHSGGQVIQNKTIVADAKIIGDDEVLKPKKASVKRTRKVANDIPITVANLTSESQLLSICRKTKATVKRKTVGKINAKRGNKTDSSEKESDLIKLLDQFPFSTGTFDVPEYQIVIPESVDLLKSNKPATPEEKDQVLSQLLDSVY